MTLRLLCDIILGVVNDNIGMSPSGKALDFDSSIRQFKSGHPSQHKGVPNWVPLCVGRAVQSLKMTLQNAKHFEKSSNLAR